MKKTLAFFWAFPKLSAITAFALYCFILPFFLLGSWQLGKVIGRLTQSRQHQANFTESMKLMGQWFVTNQTAQGDFRYELETATGQTKEGYNIVRQAGSLYSLAQLFGLTHNPQIETTLKQGFTFFEQLSRPEATDAAAIVYQDEKKSNGSALLLLALIEYMEADPQAQDQYLNWARQLANFLVSTQKGNGGFAYRPDIDLEESDYNNGETFYALVRIYRLDPQPEYWEAIQKAADYLVTAYPPQTPNLSFYSWSMAGFAHLYQIDPQPAYWDYLKTSTNAFINTRGKSFLPQTSQPRFIRGNWGVFLEGIIHTAWVAQSIDPQYAQYLKDFSETALLQVLTLQVEGPYGRFAARYPHLKGGICYDQSCQTQRIDIVHHNLSAVALYLKFLSQ